MFGTPPPPPGATGPGAAGRPLGSRGARVLSRLIDGIILSPISVLFFVLAWVVVAGIISSSASTCEYDSYGDYVCSEDAFLAAGVGSIAAAFFVILIGNAVALAIIAALTVRKGEKNGQTPGRQLVNVRLVRVDGRPIDWGTALLREAVYPTLLAIPLGLGTLLDWFWPLIDSRKRRLVDIWCKTEVLMAQGTAPIPPTIGAPPSAFGPPPAAMPPPTAGPFGGVR